MSLRDQLDTTLREFLAHHPADAALEILAGVAVDIANESDEMTEADRAKAEQSATEMLAAGIAARAFALGPNDHHRKPAILRLIKDAVKRLESTS